MTYAPSTSETITVTGEAPPPIPTQITLKLTTQEYYVGDEITFSGNLTYYDKNQGKYLPLQNKTIHIFKDGVEVGTTITNNLGIFLFKDVVEEGTHEYYVKYLGD